MIHQAGDTANLDELKDDLEKTPASERVSHAILRGETAPPSGAGARRQPAHRQMRDKPAIANFGIKSS